jgi:hypothetical protein
MRNDTQACQKNLKEYFEFIYYKVFVLTKEIEFSMHKMCS